MNLFDLDSPLDQVHAHLRVIERFAPEHCASALAALAKGSRSLRYEMGLLWPRKEAGEAVGSFPMTIHDYVSLLETHLERSERARWHVYYRTPDSTNYERQGVYFHEGGANLHYLKMPRKFGDHCLVIRNNWPLPKTLSSSAIDVAGFKCRTPEDPQGVTAQQVEAKAKKKFDPMGEESRKNAWLN